MVSKLEEISKKVFFTVIKRNFVIPIQKSPKEEIFQVIKQSISKMDVNRIS